MNIGIVGLGFVGKAMASTHPGALFYDPFVAGSAPSLLALASVSDALYVCVPTPMSEDDGSCDDSIVRSTLKELSDAEYAGLVIVKSTTPYDVYTVVDRKLKICFVPEMLRGRHAVEDYAKTEYFVVGADAPGVSQMYIDVIRSSTLKNAPWMFFANVSIKEAVCMKYFENTYFAAKVTLFNEYRRYCDAIGVDYSMVIYGLTLDPRIPSDHTAVPGPDGQYGWGGHCLPKDVNALLAQAREIRQPMPMVQAVVKINKEHRGE